jgi:hypothetical protein
MTEDPAVPGREIQGWYHQDNTSEAVRVRLSIEGDVLSLYTFWGRLVGSWSLDQLENRGMAMLSERWSIGDRRLPEAYLVLESDRDYSAVRAVSPALRPIRARLYWQLALEVVESGNLTGWPALILGGAVGLVLILWQVLPLRYCIAAEPSGILFLKCLLIDHFIS